MVKIPYIAKEKFLGKTEEARHKSISSTMIYTHVNKEDVENGLKQADL